MIFVGVCTRGRPIIGLAGPCTSRPFDFRSEMGNPKKGNRPVFRFSFWNRKTENEKQVYFRFSILNRNQEDPGALLERHAAEGRGRHGGLPGGAGGAAEPDRAGGLHPQPGETRGGQRGHPNLSLRPAGSLYFGWLGGDGGVRDQLLVRTSRGSGRGYTCGKDNTQQRTLMWALMRMWADTLHQILSQSIPRGPTFFRFRIGKRKTKIDLFLVFRFPKRKTGPFPYFGFPISERKSNGRDVHGPWPIIEADIQHFYEYRYQYFYTLLPMAKNALLWL